MTFRRFVFSLMGVAALCSAILASPPSRSGSEGRELDPVARDFFAPPTRASEEATPSPTREKPAETVSASFIQALVDAFTNSFTIPLGVALPRISR